MSIRFHIQKLATFNGTPGCFLHGLKSLAKKYPVKIRMLPVTLLKMTRFPLQTMSLMNTNYGEYYTNEIVRINTTSFAVRFRFIVFRPFVDEILVGKIRSCSTEGVRGTVHVYNLVLRLSHSCRCVKELSLVPTRGEFLM